MISIPKRFVSTYYLEVNLKAFIMTMCSGTREHTENGFGPFLLCVCQREWLSRGPVSYLIAISIGLNNNVLGVRCMTQVCYPPLMAMIF